MGKGGRGGVVAEIGEREFNHNVYLVFHHLHSTISESPQDEDQHLGSPYGMSIRCMSTLCYEARGTTLKSNKRRRLEEKGGGRMGKGRRYRKRREGRGRGA